MDHPLLSRLQDYSAPNLIRMVSITELVIPMLFKSAIRELSARIPSYPSLSADKIHLVH